MELQTLLYHEIELLKRVHEIVNTTTDPLLHIENLIADKKAELEALKSNNK